MLVGEILRDAGCHHPVHHPIRHLQRRHRAAELAGGRRGLEADIAPADDDHPRAGLEPLANRGYIGDAPQIVHARQFGARAGQFAGTGADRQHQPVVSDLLAVLEQDSPSIPMDSSRSFAQSELHPVSIVKRLMPERQPVGRQLACQELLGQGRPLIG